VDSKVKRSVADAKRRRQAEEIFRDKVARSLVSLDALSPQQTQLMLHELRVHQIELELQNEELRRSQLERDAAHSRYFDLYDLAPTGYCSVSEKGLILQANLTATTLLGVVRGALLGQPISRFILKEDQDIFYLTRKRVFESGELLAFELRMVKHDGTLFWAHLTATAALGADGASELRIAVSDITERKQLQLALAQQQHLVESVVNHPPFGLVADGKNRQMLVRELSKAANEALEAERRRTARELHDELGQSLTALKMDLASIRTGLASHPELERRAQGMHEILDATIAATRRIAANLRPLILDDLGLAAALDWLTQNFAKQTGIATDLVIDETVAQVPEPIASALYRIAQESLTNVTKYAQATTIEVRLERDGQWVQLLVRDNGRGIRAADHNKRGAFGLLGMRERVMLLSGEILIGGEPGRGSQVCARIPLDAAEAQ